jgi:hypothetical protein
MKNSESRWEITIVNETSEGVLCMSPDGETRFLTHLEYEKYLENKKKSQENGNIYANIEG